MKHSFCKVTDFFQVKRGRGRPRKTTVKLVPVWTMASDASFSSDSHRKRASTKLTRIDNDIHIRQPHRRITIIITTLTTGPYGNISRRSRIQKTRQNQPSLSVSANMSLAHRSTSLATVANCRCFCLSAAAVGLVPSLSSSSSSIMPARVFCKWRNCAKSLICFSMRESDRRNSSVMLRNSERDLVMSSMSLSGSSKSSLTSSDEEEDDVLSSSSGGSVFCRC